ncbi:MAG TPA: flagellar hook-length control protein FliK, partial [Steroidobacter sp.]|nr:flagellar hook-length control protein FliK [Steroidobacter sp.]
FPDGWRIVHSTVALPVGATISATVTAVGDRLELQYTGTDIVATAMAEHEAASEDSLADHERRFNLALPEADRETLRAVMASAEDSDTALMSGLFLGKLAQPLDAPKLQAVYEAQRWTGLVGASADRASMLNSDDVHQLTKAMHQALRESSTNVSLAAFHDAAAEASSQSGDDPEQERRQLAWELLNDQDGGSVEYRYGVLPLIVADQLFELDLVYFRDRQSSAALAGKSQRMVMTLNAPALGRVEVVAQAIGERVAVTIKTDSEASRQILCAERDRVTELLARLGWGVDAVSYETGGIDKRAAAHIVEHVLNGDSLSRWV